MITNNKDIPV